MNYLICDENAIFFECGYSCDNAILLRLGSDSFFITDGRYEIDAKACCKVGVEVIVDKNLIEATKKILISNNIKTLIIDPSDISLYDFNALSKDLNIAFDYEVNFSKKKRVIKSVNEIELLQKAAKMGADAFVEFSKKLPGFLGKDEFFLTYNAKETLSFYGQYELSFDPIVAINHNAAKPHATPTAQRLKEGDLLLVDAGLKFERYCSDRTRTVAVSDNVQMGYMQNFSETKKQKVYDIVCKAHDEAILQARSGMMASEIDKIARDIICNSGYGEFFVHSTGHGVGLDIHEFPVISSKSETIIEDGMVFTIEPGIYLPDEFGVRVEDTVVMRNGRAEILGV